MATRRLRKKRVDPVVNACISAVLARTKVTASGAIQCSVTEAREAIRVILAEEFASHHAMQQFSQAIMDTRPGGAI